MRRLLAILLLAAGCASKGALRTSGKSEDPTAALLVGRWVVEQPSAGFYGAREVVFAAGGAVRIDVDGKFDRGSWKDEGGLLRISGLGDGPARYSVERGPGTLLLSRDDASPVTLRADRVLPLAP